MTTAYEHDAPVLGNGRLEFWEIADRQGWSDNAVRHIMEGLIFTDPGLGHHLVRQARDRANFENGVGVYARPGSTTT